MVKINNEKLLKATGLSFDTMQDAIFYFRHRTEYLKTHNKNYTKEQEYAINDLYEFFDCIDDGGVL